MSQLDTTTKKLLTDPKKRRAWVKYQVHCRGLSIAQVAAANGVDRRTLYKAFIHPYPRMERILATAVGMKPQELFAERYDADGLPNRRMGRPPTVPRQGTKDTKGRNTPRNIQRSASDRHGRRGQAGGA